MKEKTFEKLTRKWLSKPSHVIDTNVLIETLIETKLGDKCADYLNRLKIKYRGYIPSSVLGEYFLIIFYDEKIEEKHKQRAFKFLEDLIKHRKILPLVPDREAFKLVEEIQNTEREVEDTDALHYATAVINNAKVFVTLDTKMLQSRTLGKEFGVSILSPENL
ncbi:MAG: PIN domain-containing protein [Candidatus Aenigmarchaeota archaeon]|nr:PIN domain-containing protein [Candidatus Aenigmarchaeota archaeon]